jgi:hypothetical protein
VKKSVVPTEGIGMMPWEVYAYQKLVFEVEFGLISRAKTHKELYIPDPPGIDVLLVLL